MYEDMFFYFPSYYPGDFDMCCPIAEEKKWYNPSDRHNYRKMHRITPRRVVKRRDRQSRGSVLLLKVECAEDEEEN